MSTITVTTYEAKVQLSKLLAACERGEDVTITRGATPVARLVPILQPPPREFGFLPLDLSTASQAESVAPLDEVVLPDWLRESLS